MSGSSVRSGMYSSPVTEVLIVEPLCGDASNEAQFLCYLGDPNLICSNKLYVVEDSSRPGQAATEFVTDSNIATISSAHAYKNFIRHKPRNVPKYLPGHRRLRFTHDFSCSKPLTSFSSSKEMMFAVYDAYAAHGDAFRLCKILHGDIGIRNVIIKRDGRGVLSDWDLAHEVGWKPPRQCAGSWQFMSTFKLEHPDKVHTIQDDMESFVLIVLYLTLRFMQHNRMLDLATITSNIFDSRTVLHDGSAIGGHGKGRMFTNRAWIGRDFAVTDNEPLTDWLYTALDAVKAYHIYYYEVIAARSLRPTRRRPRAAPGLPTVSPTLFDSLELTDHHALDEAWEDFLTLPDWPSGDKACDNFKSSKSLYSGSNGKRALDQAGADLLDTTKSKRMKPSGNVLFDGLKEATSMREL